MGLGRRLESDGTFTVGLTVVRLGGSGGMKMDDGEVGILCDLGSCFGCWLIEGWQFEEVLALLFRDWLLLIGSRFALTPKLIQDNELKNKTCDCKKWIKPMNQHLLFAKLEKNN